MADNKEKIEKLKKGLNNPNISDAHKELMRKKIAELEVSSKTKKEQKKDTNRGDFAYNENKYIDYTKLTSLQKGRLKKMLLNLYDIDGEVRSLGVFISRGIFIGKDIETQKYSNKKVNLEYKELKNPKKIYSLIMKDESSIEVPKIVYDSIILNEGKIKKEVKSGSADVKDIIAEYSYMDKRLKGVTGKVDFVIVERDVKTKGGDKYMIEIHQNGKKLADFGTTPNIPVEGYMVSDNFNKTKPKKEIKSNDIDDILLELKSKKNKFGRTKSVEINERYKKAIDKLELTKENNQYARPIINSKTLVKYEPAKGDKKQGIRIINHNSVLNKNEFRIYRKIKEENEDPLSYAFNERLGSKNDPSKKNIYTPPKKDKKEANNEPNKHTYMMLSRLVRDNEYYLGYGNKSEKHLWAGNVEGQISEMKKLWNELPKDGKPEWLSLNDILDYEEKMLKAKKSVRDEDIEAFLKANPKKTKKEAEIYFDNLEAKKGFEFGTPVTFKHNGNKVSGEVISKNGKKVVSLYKDSNYSGNSERIVEPNWIKVSSFNKANSKIKTKAKSKPKKRTNNTLKEFHKLAKEIRKEGESYRDAFKRASKILKGDDKNTKPKKKKINRKKPKQTGTSKKSIDSKRKALPVGKRVSKNGKVYYEYRANRSDIDPKKKL